MFPKNRPISDCEANTRFAVRLGENRPEPQSTVVSGQFLYYALSVRNGSDQLRAGSLRIGY
jgi:hypothetical protein